MGKNIGIQRTLEKRRLQKHQIAFSNLIARFIFQTMNEWHPLLAVGLVIFPVVLVCSAWWYLAYPDCANRQAVLACVTLTAVISFFTSRVVIPIEQVEDIYLRFLIMFLSHIWFLHGLQPEAWVVDTRVSVV